ncbi:MAG: 2-hydroxychromene-2-carboxylate isomerase [Gammaproteobacteria bacterium]|nr:2-hydroxychromene-2-carboxylate isomerase [Gammaproteobacteria bacterium]
MSKRIKVEWYFDFISPFAYLQFEKLNTLPECAEIVFRPVLLAGLLNHWGHKGPAEIASKRKFTYRFIQWLAERENIPIRFPESHPFNPMKLLRLALLFDKDDHNAIREIFRFVWVSGKLPHDDDAWLELTHTLNEPEAGKKIQDAAIKKELQDNGTRAINQGVFGVPSFVINGELFWGLDATDMVRDYLANTRLFEVDKMRRLDAITIGASRL